MLRSQFLTCQAYGCFLQNAGKRVKKEANCGIAISPKLDISGAWPNSFAAALFRSIIRILDCHHNSCNSSLEGASFSFIAIYIPTQQTFIISASEARTKRLRRMYSFMYANSIYIGGVV